MEYLIILKTIIYTQSQDFQTDFFLLSLFCLVLNLEYLKASFLALCKVHLAHSSQGSQHFMHQFGLKNYMGKLQ